VYLATAQLAQSAALLFNVRFQIPYRKAIARKTTIVQRLRHKVMMRILAIPALIAPVGLVGGFLIFPNELSSAWLAGLLLPFLVGDALTFAILVAHMDYLQWLRRQAKLLRTYIACAMLLGVFLVLLRTPIVIERISIVGVVAAFTLLGLAWVGILVRMNFSNCQRSPRSASAQ
jgi:hypothetical protein